MKNHFFLILVLISISITLHAQDRIIKITKDTIVCQIKEIGDDEIKYTQKDFRGDLIFGIDKNKVSRVIFSDGKELTFKNSMYDPAQYEKQRKNAMKVGFLSPLFGATSFTFEHSLKPGSSVEATLGIIGLGTDINENSSGGVYMKLGYKFIKSPDFYLKGMQYAHILKGGYIRPEVSFVTYSFQPGQIYNSSTGTYISGSKKSNTMYAFMLNFGKQWVFQDRFLVDWFLGAGYGTGNASASDNDLFHYAFVGGSGTAFVMTSGIRIGVLF